MWGLLVFLETLASFSCAGLVRAGLRDGGGCGGRDGGDTREFLRARPYLCKPCRKAAGESFTCAPLALTAGFVLALLCFRSFNTCEVEKKQTTNYYYFR